MSSSTPPDPRFDSPTEPDGAASQMPEIPAPPTTPTTPAPPTTPLPPDSYGAPPQPYPTYPQYQRGPEYQAPQPPRQRSRLPSWAVPLLVIMAIVLIIIGVGAGLALSRAGSNTPTARDVLPAATIPVAPAATDLQQQVVNVIRTVQPSVVQVQSTGGQGGAIGSGEIVRSDGYIVTNDHVVAGFSQFSVLLSNGKSYPAQLKGEDPQDDLALLKIDTGSALQPIAFGDSGKAQVGQFVVALGSPLGLQQSATFGIVSALNRTASEGPSGPARELTGLIQTSAPINPGNSGGALVDLSGQLIGVPTLGAVDPNSGGTAPGIGFAIPSNRVQYVVDQLIKNGHLVSSGQGFLGIEGQDVTPQLASAYHLSAQSGVLVVGFANAANGASPAQQAGIQQQDIITAVDGQTVNTSDDLAAALQSKSPGTQVKISLLRGSSQQAVTVTLGERPTNAG
ncbi:MAG TPA: trypsin-like peptidase domain-containing protein [Ktedonobacterales bacterium]